MITLAISTSSGQFALAFGKNDKIIFNSESLNLTDNKDIGLLFKEGLKNTGKSIDDIEKIIVDKGPGGTSGVRTGVAFVNSLSYSLGIPVYPVSSLELAGITVWEKHKIPVISTVKSIKNNAFIGCFERYNKFSIFYGKISEILPELTLKFNKIAVVGYHRDLIQELLQSKTVYDTGLKYGNIELLIKKQTLFLDRVLTFPHITIPITEQNI